MWEESHPLQVIYYPSYPLATILRLQLVVINSLPHSPRSGNELIYSLVNTKLIKHTHLRFLQLRMLILLCFHHYLLEDLPYPELSVYFEHTHKRSYVHVLY